MFWILEQEAAAQAKKEREEAIAAEKAAAAEKATPDYAAGLGGSNSTTINKVSMCCVLYCKCCGIPAIKNLMVNKTCFRLSHKSFFVFFGDCG